MAALEHRRNPPVLGYFREATDGIHFQPTISDAPNRVPQGRFSPSPIGDGDRGTLLGCRHGLVLIFHSSKDDQVLVWDPVTGDQRRIATPPGLDVHETPFDGAVLRAAGGHFQVVLVGYKKKRNPRVTVCIYSSETGVWSNLLSTPVPRDAVRYQAMPAVLVGDSLYWLCSSVILKVDLRGQDLAVIQVPADMSAKDKYLMRAEGGGLGLFSLSEYTAQLWKKRNTDADGVSSWVLGRTVELGRLLSLDSKRETSYIQMIGYAEENNVAFLRTVAGIFMVQLETLQFKKLPENNNCVVCYPLESVYAAETSTGGGHDALDSTASPISAQAGEMTALEYRHNPPVLGFFHETLDGINFQPTMEAPNRVPHGRFSSPISDGDSGTLLGCRHGLVLIFHSSRDQILVWDPVTGDQHRAAAPPRFDVHQTPFDGAVLRAAGDHFKVVLVGYKQKKNPRAIVCLYSSETGVWSNLIETHVPRDAAGYQGMPAVLVGDSLYWLCSSVILKVDLCRQSLAVIQVPADMFAEDKYLMVMRAEGGGLGLLSLSECTAQLWKRNTDGNGVSSWVLGRTIELGRLLSLDSKRETRSIHMIGYAEENNVAFFRTVAGIFMVQLETLQFKKLLENNNSVVCYPLETVYAAERSIGGGHDALDSAASPMSMSASVGKMTALEHRCNPPILGYFREAIDGIHFQPTMEGPNHVPHGRFSSPIGDGDNSTLLGCRHGLVLIFHSSRDQILVWDPVTGEQHYIATPLGFDVHQTPFDGAVLRAAAEHFQVVLVGYKQNGNPQAIVCIYSSETRLWSNLIETPVPRDAVEYEGMPAVLVEDSLYWLSSSVILKVDLCRQSLNVIQVRVDMFAKDNYLMAMQAEGGGLGLLSLSECTAQLWKRNTDADGVFSWVLGRTIELDRLLTLDSKKETRYIQMIGYAEENNVAFLRTAAGIFMVQLHSLQFKKLLENNNSVTCYPLESVYAAETSIGGGHDGADQHMLM